MNKWEHTMVITRFVYDRTSSSNWSSKAGCLCKLRCDVKSSLFYAFLSRQHQDTHAWPGTPTVYTSFNHELLCWKISRHPKGLSRHPLPDSHLGRTRDGFHRYETFSHSIIFFFRSTSNSQYLTHLFFCFPLLPRRFFLLTRCMRPAPANREQVDVSF